MLPGKSVPAKHELYLLFLSLKIFAFTCKAVLMTMNSKQFVQYIHILNMCDCLQSSFCFLSLNSLPIAFKAN